ncbi:MAG TPA: peptidoglycan-associated lipoprotein Pal [Desulfuromonadales bacterium]|nr:peptidoglycan-associated lipoprotein Pal [Desulfuromonadales bacterium]
MKKNNILRLMVTIAMAALLAAGCAKKPAPEVVAPAPAPPPPAYEQPMVSEMPPQPVPGLQEQAVAEMPVAPEMVAVAGLQRINFAYDQYTLSDQAREVLAGNAAWMKANPGARVIVEGHCDERGSDEYNLALGERRALAAQNYLVSLGIAAGRLSTVSYGEERPLAPGKGETAWAQNRRAEFKVVK